MITLEEAMKYFREERLFSDKWLGAPTLVQNQSLKMAQNQIQSLRLNSHIDEQREITIKKAICEQALHLFENSQRQKLINQGVTSFSVEGLSESYDLSRTSRGICLESKELLRPYMIGSVSIC